MAASAELLMHPVRLRIIQFAAGHGSFTAAQLAGNMPDVPKATLYRHIKTLSENGVLTVVSQEKKRGTYLHTYSLNRLSVSGDTSGPGMQAGVYAILGKLMEDFRSYFSSEETAPFDDKIFLTINSLFLDDSCFESFIEELFGVVKKYMRIPHDPEGKQRMITVVSSPAEQQSF